MILFKSYHAKVTARIAYRLLSNLCRTPDFIVKNIEHEGQVHLYLCYEDTDAYATVTEIIGVMMSRIDGIWCGLRKGDYGTYLYLHVPYDLFYSKVMEVITYFRSEED